MDWKALSLTAQVAACSTIILLVIGLPLAYWLATTRWRWKFLIEAVVALPLVLPPTVLGFYLLIATGPRSPLGRFFEATVGHALPFSFGGILVGSVLFNLPFAVRPFTAAFASVDRRMVEAAWCLRVSRWATFFRVTLPLAWAGVLTGIILTFAHAVGEFGVVLMIGGNIPDVTRTLSISIYDNVQALDYTTANHEALVLLGFAFSILSVVYALQRRVLPL
jgi:molybdate transport system permease protein